MSIPLNLKRSDNNQGEFYYLKYPSANWPLKKLFFFLKLPVRVFQYTIGRPITYFLLNPFFRKMEHNKTVLTQNKKYPDPMLKETQDIVILNVIPETHFLLRVLFNWIYHLKEFFFRAPFLSLLFADKPQKRYKLYPNHLDQVIEQVGALLNPTAGEKKWTPDQIHFKGLERLSPTKRVQFFNTLKSDHGYNFEQNAKQYNFFTLQTNTGGRLDSLEVRGPTVTQQPIEKRTFIISCLPRSNNYHDWIKQHRFFADELDTTVVAFNYRGIGLSKGIVINQDDMRDDAASQVHRLIAMGANPANIAIMGECLGANIATRTAADLHAEGYPIKLFNARSFRSLPAILLARVAPAKNASPLLPLTWLQKAMALTIKYIVVPLTYLVGWDLSVDEAFKSIPPKDRGFLTVRSKKDATTHQRYIDDTMIPHQTASIYSLVKEEQNRCLEKQRRHEHLTVAEQDLLNDSIKSHQFFVSPVVRENASKTDGHTCPLRYLAPTRPIQEIAAPDGREYTLGFFKRVGIQTNATACRVARKNSACDYTTMP